MPKKHEITVEDFHLHQVKEQLASASVPSGDGRVKRKVLYFLTFPSNPGQFHYEVHFGYDEPKSFKDIENAVNFYNEI